MNDISDSISFNHKSSEIGVLWFCVQMSKLFCHVNFFRKIGKLSHFVSSNNCKSILDLCHCHWQGKIDVMCDMVIYVLFDKTKDYKRFYEFLLISLSTPVDNNINSDCICKQYDQEIECID